MRKIFKLGLISLVPILGGSAIGGYAWHQSPEERAKRVVLSKLNDPDSAAFSELETCKGHYVTGLVNSKNSFGGFTGKKRFVVDFIADGAVEGPDEKVLILRIEGEENSTGVVENFIRARGVYANRKMDCYALYEASADEEQLEKDEQAWGAATIASAKKLVGYREPVAEVEEVLDNAAHEEP